MLYIKLLISLITKYNFDLKYNSTISLSFRMISDFFNYICEERLNFIFL